MAVAVVGLTPRASPAAEYDCGSFGKPDVKAKKCVCETGFQETNVSDVSRCLPSPPTAPPKDSEETNQRIMADAAATFDSIPGLFAKTRYDGAFEQVLRRIDDDTAQRGKLKKRWTDMAAKFPGEATAFQPVIYAEMALFADVMRIAIDAAKLTILHADTETKVAAIEAKAHKILQDPIASEESKVNAQALLEKAKAIRDNATKAWTDKKATLLADLDAELVGNYARAWLVLAKMPKGKEALAGLVRTRLAHYEQMVGNTVMKAHCEKVAGFSYKPKMFKLP